MALTLTTADAVLKEDYKGPVTDALNQSFMILSQIESNSDDVQGRRAVHPIHVTRNSGVGARVSGGALPSAGNQGYVDTYVPLRRNYGRIQLNGDVIAAMKADRGSFLRAVDGEMKGVTNDLKRDVNRQVWGTSDGVIAVCGTTNSSTTVVLATTTTATQLRQLGSDDGGIVIDIGTVASPQTIASARTITSIDTSAKTIVISGAAVTTSSSHRIFRASAGGATDNSGGNADGQAELTGLQTIVSSGGYLHAVTGATYPAWNASVYDNSGTNRAVSETLVNKAIQDVEVKSGDKVDLLATSTGVHQAVAALLSSMRRNVDNVALKAGYSGIAWSSPGEFREGSRTRALVWDRDCPENRIFGLCTGELVQYYASDWDWMDQDGAVLSRVSGYDAYEATLFKYHELAARKRNCHFVIKDLTAAS